MNVFDPSVNVDRPSDRLYVLLLCLGAEIDAPVTGATMQPDAQNIVVPLQ